MKGLGLLFVIVGVAVLVDKGISYPTTTHFVDLGPLHASFHRTAHIYLEPLVGVCGVVGGVLLLLRGRKSKEG